MAKHPPPKSAFETAPQPQPPHPTLDLNTRVELDTQSQLRSVSNSVVPVSKAIPLPGVFAPITESPSIQSIFSAKIPTRAYIPANCIQLFGQALKFAIDEVCSKNDTSSWSQLFALPKCTLSHFEPSINTKSATSTSSVIKQNLLSFLSGDWVKLFTKACDRVASQPMGPPGKRDWSSLVISKAQNGNLSGAFKSLDSPGLSPVTPEVISKLKSLHPSDPKLGSPKFSPSTSDLTFSPQMLDKVIKSFPNGSAPGPDGLRPQHLSDLLRLVPKSSSGDVRPSLSRLVLLLINGKAPPAIAPYFSSARLIPLKKDNDGIRPIAVGLTWRRLCGKMVNLIISDRIPQVFNPIQFGVGTRFGSETVVHSVRQALESNADNDDFVLFQADFSNAFNRVSRSSFLDQAKKEFPSILPFISYCYSLSPLLFVSQSSTIIESLNGTQQGDPLGPLLFCLAIRPLLESFSKNFPDLLNLWYMDDGFIGGPSATVSKVVSLLVDSGPPLGVFLNLEKSRLTWTHPSMKNAQLFSPLIPRSSGGVVVLGSPIGSASFTSTFFRASSDHNEKIILKLPKLNDPQIAFTLLSKCMGLSKVGYFLRTTPCAATSDLASRFDLQTTAALGIILGKDIPKLSQLQSQLPSKMGGLGLRSASKHSPAAFISSLNSCATNLESILKPDVTSTISSREKEEASKLLVNSLGGSPLDSILTCNSQKSISASIDKQVFSSLMNSSSSKSKARIHSCMGSQANAILSAPLAPIRGFRLSAQEFCHFISTRIGLQNISNEGDKCTHCNAPLDPLGYHVSICKFGEFSVTYRHNAIRNVLFTQCQRAAWSPKMEYTVSPQDNQLRPADIFIPIGPSSRPIAIDVTIVNPMAPNMVEGASKSNDFANSQAEKRKITKYSSSCAKADITFKALAIESFGRLSPQTVSFVSKLATAIANRFDGKSSSIFKDIERRITAALIRSSARAALDRVPSRLAF